MIFIGKAELASVQLRGMQVAASLGARFSEQVGGSRDDIVVFVKDADKREVKKAKNQGCIVAYDILDFLCYEGRKIEFADEVDIVIVPNNQCETIYRHIFPRSRFVVIPHHWDPRINGECLQDEVRLGYIGNLFNMAEHFQRIRLPFRVVTKPEDMPGAAHRFNLHLCFSKREGISRIAKPATKVSTAAAVGAVAVAFKDPSVVEILGETYPFYVDRDIHKTVKEAWESFGSDTWRKARNMMSMVKEKTSLPTVSELYSQLEAVYAT